MSGNKKYALKKIGIISVWMLLVSGMVVLLIAAISRKNDDRISGIDIHISGVQNNYFINKKDVLSIMEKVNGQKFESTPVNSLNLTSLEDRLQKEPWIEKAEIFFDNNNIMQVKVKEREPIARIFTSSGASFYIDSSLTRLPLSNKFSARLPVFTGFPTDVRVLKKQDSVLLNEIKVLSEYVGTHPFWMAQIDQIDITASRDFEMVPKLGNQIIRFGNTDFYKEKFNKLLAFYKQVQTRVGWNKYSVLDIRFRNQVIGVNRDAKEIKADSLRSVQIMKSLIEEAKKNSDDSTKIQLPPVSDNNQRVNSSPVLDNVPDETINIKNTGTNTSAKNIDPVVTIQNDEKPSLKKPIPERNKSITIHSSSNEKPHTPILKKGTGKKTAVKKQNEKSEEAAHRVPKAVMPPKSDY